MSFNLLTMKRLNDRYMLSVLKKTEYMHVSSRMSIFPQKKHITLKIIPSVIQSSENDRQLNDGNMFCILKCILQLKHNLFKDVNFSLEKKTTYYTILINFFVIPDVIQSTNNEKT